MGGSQSTLTDPNSDLSKIYSNITNSTSNLATKTDLTNNISNLAKQSDLTILSSGLTSATAGLTSATASLTSATAGLTSSTSTLQSLTPTLVTQTNLNSAVSNLAAKSDLTSINTLLNTIQTSMSESQGLTNVICPNGYRYARTVTLAGNSSNTLLAPYCIADPYKTNTVIPPPPSTFGSGGTQNTSMTVMAPPIGICPYGDLLYNTNNFPICVISMEDYQSRACKYGVLTTTKKTDKDGNLYQVTTCRTAP